MQYNHFSNTTQDIFVVLYRGNALQFLPAQLI